ncbi:MAG: hypothetical protein V1889_00890 [archaeon]
MGPINILYVLYSCDGRFWTGVETSDPDLLKILIRERPCFEYEVTELNNGAALTVTEYRRGDAATSSTTTRKLLSVTKKTNDGDIRREFRDAAIGYLEKKAESFSEGYLVRVKDGT